jgi:hypothetical protein
VGSKPNLFLHAILCLENLSSGENLAGCAESVGFPSGAVFCEFNFGGGGEREEREENCVRERIRSAQFFFMKQRVNERERDKRERDPIETRVVVKKSLTLSVYTRFPSSFR